MKDVPKEGLEPSRGVTPADFESVPHDPGGAKAPVFPWGNGASTRLERHDPQASPTPYATPRDGGSRTRGHDSTIPAAYIPSARIAGILAGEPYAPPDPLENLSKEIRIACAWLRDPFLGTKAREDLARYARACSDLMHGLRPPPPPTFASLQVPTAQGSIRVIAHPAAPPGGLLVSDTNHLAQALRSALDATPPPGMSPAACLAQVQTLAEMMAPAPAEGLDVEQIARALFETDETVRRFVDRVSDAFKPGGEVDDANAVDLGRVRRAFDLAWERDELGARTRHVERAREIVAHLRGVR